MGGGGGTGHVGGAPRISNKVDVWSCGVILYQMLYGRRPFGEGLSQEQVYRDGIVRNARAVEFPAKPAVSAEGKAFISRCLAPRQEDRWDVLTAAGDAYLQLKR
jgi:tousled-like kinase